MIKIVFVSQPFFQFHLHSVVMPCNYKKLGMDFDALVNLFTTIQHSIQGFH